MDSDDKLKRLMEQIHLPGLIKLDKPYQHFKGELSVLDAVLLKRHQDCHTYLNETADGEISARRTLRNRKMQEACTRHA